MDEQKLNQLLFYPTPPSPCSYLPQQESKSIFLHPDQSIDDDLYHQLSLLGFRRSGGHIYRPWCDDCQACKSVRVLAQEFSPSRNQKRLLSRNKDLHVTWEAASYSDLYYDLYQRYINLRHSDGDMYPPSEEQFTSFLCQPSAGVTNYFLCFWLGEQLLSVAVVDLLPDGSSAIYTFFDPDQEQRSLGKLAILWLLNWTKQNDLKYVYLGYWVKNCRKMDYKINYKPLQIFDGLQWRTPNELEIQN